MRRTTRLLAAASTLAALAWSGSAMAQDVDPSVQADEVDEIVVTARKREERLFDVPVAVTAVNAETLEERQFQSVRDIAQVTPGLNINSDSAGRAFISIRGVGITLLDNVQPGVGIFVDGVYQQNTSYLNSPTLALEQIEVLRGPQGTLFGQNTLGGAINITTRQPSDVMEGRVTGTYAGPDNFYTVGATVAGPIVTGRIQGRLSVGAQGRDGFIDNTLLGYDDANRLAQRTVRGALRFDLPAAAELTVNAYYDRVEGSGPLYALTTGPTVYSNDSQYNVRSTLDFDYSGLNGRLVVPFGDTEMTVIVAHDRRDSEGVGDSDFQPISLALGASTQELRTSTGEARFDTQWTDNISTLIGVFASHQTSFASSTTTIVPLALSSTATADTDIDLYAGFGTLFWDFAPGWELALGLRFDHQTVESVAHTGFTSTYEADEWQPRFTLRRTLGDSMIYGSIARGFRGGGANGPGAPNPLWDGDSVWTYEFGGRTRLAGGRAILSGAVFYNNYSDVIGQNSLAPSTTGVGFVGINLNSGDARSIGLEGEFTAFVTDAWTVRGGFVVQNARFTDTTRYQTTTGRTLPSDRFPFEPDWTANLQSDYVVPFGDGELVFAGGIYGKGDRLGSGLSNTFAPELEAYWLANASVTWRYDGLEVAAFANNIFDTEYYESYIDSSTLTVAGLPALGSLGLMGDGRRIGIRVGYSF